MSRPK